MDTRTRLLAAAVFLVAVGLLGTAAPRRRGRVAAAVMALQPLLWLLFTLPFALPDPLAPVVLAAMVVPLFVVWPLSEVLEGHAAGARLLLLVGLVATTVPIDRFVPPSLLDGGMVWDAIPGEGLAAGLGALACGLALVVGTRRRVTPVAPGHPVPSATGHA